MSIVILISVIILFPQISIPQTDNQYQDESRKIKYHFINSIPQNASLYLNDSLLGYTPVRFLNKLKENDKLTVKLKNYKDFIYVVQSSDTLLNKTFQLIRTYTLKTYTNNQELVIEDKPVIFEKRRRFIPISILSTITLGSAALSYHFKTKANDYYAQYLSLGDKSFLDKAKKFDIYSGISLAIFQIGIVGVIYFLFIE